MRNALHHESRLTIINSFRNLSGGRRKWFYLCVCSCGSQKEIYKSSVDLGLTRSCGCLHKEVQIATGKHSNLKHGEGAKGKISPEYSSWRAMLKRCYQPSHDSYVHYGGSGVVVCERWLSSFANFLADVGRRPTNKHTLDRYPNNSVNYEPGNVRWATAEQQARNRKDNVLLTIGEKTQCIAAWSDEIGVSGKLIAKKKRDGWDDERSVSTIDQRKKTVVS